MLPSDILRARAPHPGRSFRRSLVGFGPLGMTRQCHSEPREDGTKNLTVYTFSDEEIIR